jgi:hypothetical protein
MNQNLVTNSQDYVLFRAQLGAPSVGPVYNKADINANAVVNSQDYVLFVACSVTVGPGAGRKGPPDPAGQHTGCQSPGVLHLTGTEEQAAAAYRS